MRFVRICSGVFTALPIKYRTHYLAVIDYVFDAFIAILGAFTNLLDKCISFFFVRTKISVNV